MKRERFETFAMSSSINDMIAAIDHKRAMQINWRPFLNFSSHESRCKKNWPLSRDHFGS